MKKKFTKTLSTTLAAVLATAALTACSSGSSTSDAASNENEAEAVADTSEEGGDVSSSENADESSSTGDKKVIKVGTGAVWKPFLYLDEDENLIGYDIDVVNAVADKLGYEVEFDIEEFDVLFSSLSSGKYDLITFELGYTDERAENYLFASEPYNTIDVYLTVAADSDINDISELQDAHLWSGDSASTYYNFLKTYADEHPEQNITIDVQSGTEFDETVIEAVQNGTFAGFISNKVSIDNVNEVYGEVYKQVGDPVISQDTYHIFKKGNEELRDEWDTALQELIDDGTIDELKDKWNL